MGQRSDRLSANKRPFGSAASVGADKDKIGAGIFGSLDDAGAATVITASG